MTCKCCCTPSVVWWDHTRNEESDKLTEYVRDRAKDIADHKCMPNLLDLRKLPIATCGSIETIRGLVSEDIPFRIDGCSRSLTCCGECTVKCSRRCIQDIYNKLYMLVYNEYHGHGDSRPEIRAVIDSMQSTKVTYKGLTYLYNDIFIARKNQVLQKRMEDLDGEHPYRYVYAPMIERKVYPSGCQKSVADPVTGVYRIYEWPESGMCPYCLPRYTQRNSSRAPGAIERAERAAKKLEKLR